MKTIRLLLPLLLFAAFCSLCASAYGTAWESYSRKRCGPVRWYWKLPPGNGHFVAPNRCLQPPAYYTPQLPLYYRGPMLRTIEQPLLPPEPSE